MAKAIKKKVVAVPKDRVELEQFVADIRAAEQAITEIENELNEHILRLARKIDEFKTAARINARAWEEKIEELAKGVYIYAQGHRAELTEQEVKKTVEFSTGDKIRWYFTPPSVTVGDEEEAIKELEKKKLLDFIRIKKEIDKEAILREPEKIKNLEHLSVGQEEIFSIVLSEIKVALEKGKRKFKKVDL